MFSTYLANKIIDHVCRRVSYTPPTTLWLSLHSADPGSTGANELSGNGYARVEVTNAFAVASSKATTNTVEVAFPEASGNWSQATHACLWDAPSGGNPLISGALTTPRTATSGVTIRFKTGDLDLGLT